MRSRHAAEVLAAGALATGCLSVPPYDPRPLVTYTDAGSGGMVMGPGFALPFSGSGFHFPDQLLVDTIDVMGHDPTTSCSDQSESGLQLVPSRRISVDDAPASSMIQRSQLVPVMRGPAIVQVTLDWASRFDNACSVTHNPNGTSTFTVFPDGRIVRHDTIDDPDHSLLSTTACSCDPLQSESFYTSTYWTLARTSFQSLTTPSISGPQALPDEGLTGPNTNIDYACFDGGAYQVTVAWNHRQSDMGPNNARDTAVLGGRTLIGVRRTTAANTDPDLTVLELEETSALFIGHTNCTSETDRATRYLDPPKLLIGDTVVSPSLSSGLYGGDNGDGPFDLGPEHDRAMLTGPVDTPFAVWLRFPRAVETIRATHAGSTGAWYVPQRTDDRSWIVWFADPLKAGEQIVVEPN